MFDFTRSARIIALALPAYILLWPLWVIVGGLVDVVSGSRGMLDAADWLSWPVPCVFALLSLILLGDLWQRLSAGRLSTTELTAYRVAGILMLGGSLFALGTSVVPAAICAAAVVISFCIPKRRAQPSTWEPR